MNYTGSLTNGSYDDKMDVDRRLHDFARKVDQFDVQTHESPDGPDLAGVHHRVKIALSLYKVQQNIYLLDFQRLDVSVTIECCLSAVYAESYYMMLFSFIH